MYAIRSYYALDRERFGRAFLNLMVNAQQALQGCDRRDKSIHVTSRNLGARVEISIQDNGPGIPEEIREKIFEPSYNFV